MLEYLQMDRMHLHFASHSTRVFSSNHIFPFALNAVPFTCTEQLHVELMRSTFLSFWFSKHICRILLPCYSESSAPKNKLLALAKSGHNRVEANSSSCSRNHSGKKQKQCTTSFRLLGIFAHKEENFYTYLTGQNLLPLSH